MYYMGMPIFDYARPKIIEITFSFPKFPAACKKIKNQFIPSIQSWDTVNDQTGPTRFWPRLSQILLTNF